MGKTKERIMDIPVVCMTCGTSLGDKAMIFIAMRQEKINDVLSSKKIRKELLYIDPDANVEVGSILDELKVDRMCCRKCMMSAVLRSDVIPST